jgi:hypothetical protein
MSCCGNRRKALFGQRDSVRHRSDQAVSVVKELADKVFEYTGDSALTIQGTSGKFYHFSYKGEQVTVSYYDSFSMMAERDLKKV